MLSVIAKSTGNLAANIENNAQLCASRPHNDMSKSWK